jgi:hypothetical protein
VSNEPLSDRILDFGFGYVICWPLTITENSKSKFVRFIGLLTWLLWFMIGALLSWPFLIIGTLVSMCEFVWRGNRES